MIPHVRLVVGWLVGRSDSHEFLHARARRYTTMLPSENLLYQPPMLVTDYLLLILLFYSVSTNFCQELIDSSAREVEGQQVFFSSDAVSSLAKFELVVFPLSSLSTRVQKLIPLKQTAL